MPAYYAMGYLSGVLFRVTTIGGHPHAKTPNAGLELRPTGTEPKTAKKPTLWAVSSERCSSKPLTRQ